MRVLWIENVCDDDEVIEANIRETKLSSPDYKDMDAERGECGGCRTRSCMRANAA